MVSEAVPPIVIPAGDAGRLRRLALRALNDANPAARFLLSELDRATVFETTAMPDDVVRLGQWVAYRADADAPVTTQVLLVPDECVNPAVHLSVMAPVGAALLGLRVGARMPYRDSDGVTRVAFVDSLSAPPGIAFFRRGAARPSARHPGSAPDPDPGPSAA